jgi:two-component system, LuxR family, response regulator FixJ
MDPCRRRPAAVAVVDDDQGVRDSMRFLLEMGGYDVETYASGAEFLERTGPEPLGCLVIDQQMPGLTGLDLIRALQERGGTTPTLLIVSTPSAAVSRRAAELGVGEVLEKPMAEIDLLARIGAALAS